MSDYDFNTTLLIDIIKHLNAVIECLSRLDIDSLPSVLIEDIHVARLLPFDTSAIYFLSHPEKGLLYIGTASNLQGRWSLKCDMFGEFSVELTHSCLDPAINLGNVRLSWWSVPKECLVTLESFLIRDLLPRWNQRGRTGGKATNDRGDYTTRKKEEMEAQKVWEAEKEERRRKHEEYLERVKLKKAERSRKLAALRRLRKKKFKESMKKVPCPFCQREFIKRGLKIHERTCPLKPPANATDPP
jgi:hypothetical protein